VGQAVVYIVISVYGDKCDDGGVDRIDIAGYLL